MKYFLLITFIIFYYPSNSQVIVSPVVGMEFNTFGGKVSKKYYSYYYTTFWESRGLLLGISASHPLTQKLDLEFTSCFTKNRELIRDRALVQYTFGIDYNLVLNNLVVKKKFGEIINVKAGIGMNLYFNIRNYFPIDEKEDGKKVQSRFFDFGLPIGISIKKYGFVFNLTYFQGIFGHHTWYNARISPIKNIWFDLGYQFNLN